MLVAVRRLAALNGGLLRGTSNHVSLCCGAVFCCSSLASRDHFSLEHGRICVSLEHGRTCIEFTAGEKRKCTGEGRENMPHGLCRCRTWTEGGRMGDAAPPFRPPTPDSHSHPPSRFPPGAGAGPGKGGRRGGGRCCQPMRA